MDESPKIFTQIPAFLEYLGPECAPAIANAAPHGKLDLSPKFPFVCSRHYADLIRKANEPEALLREILPHVDERENVAGFVDDPVGDLPAGKADCVIQKYDRRALIVSTATCGARCTGSTRTATYGKSSFRAATRSCWAPVNSATWWRR